MIPSSVELLLFWLVFSTSLQPIVFYLKGNILYSIFLFFEKKGLIWHKKQLRKEDLSERVFSYLDFD